MLNYRCLVLDHDDTVVRSEETVNYPSFLEALKVLRPGRTITREEFTRWCFSPGFSALCSDYIGLTPEECKMVFSRFWRADAGRNRESGGLGVGLAVVKEIVDRHGGWVQVEGRKDEGACFTIHIPLYDEGRTPKARQQKPKQTKVPKAAKGKEKQRPKGHR